MVFNTLSDPFLIAAFWTGAGALALTLLIGAQIVYLRGALRRYEKHEREVIAKWRPVLNAAMAAAPSATLPALDSREHLLFLKLWVHLHQSVRGAASAGLNDVGYRLGCDAYARQLLQRGNRAEKLLAALALGHLRDVAAWPLLLAETHARDGTLSVQALWALVQIDAATAARELMPLLLRRDDWALSQVAGILQDARDQCVPVLAGILPQLERERVPRALQLAEALRLSIPSPLLSTLMRDTSVDAAIAAVRVAATPDLLDDVRTLHTHPDWRVRVQVAKALGRIGDRPDVARLQSMLGDPQWWVRYRAAQALAGLPFLSGAELDALCAGLADRFSADMLRQVRAEQEQR